MSLEISNVLELMEVTVFTRLLEAFISEGYCPDVRNSTLYPNSKEGMDSYIQAQRAIAISKGFCVEVFGVSDIDAKLDKESPRVVIVPEGYQSSQTGNCPYPEYQYVEATGTYKKIKRIGKLSDYYFRVHLISNSTSQYRTLLSILPLALPIRGYIMSYDNSTPLFVERMSTMNYNDTRYGVNEFAYRYKIPDVEEADPEIISTTIAAISSISLRLKMQNYFGILSEIYEETLIEEALRASNVVKRASNINIKVS